MNMSVEEINIHEYGVATRSCVIRHARFRGISHYESYKSDCCGIPQFAVVSGAGTDQRYLEPQAASAVGKLNVSARTDGTFGIGLAHGDLDSFDTYARFAIHSLEPSFVRRKRCSREGRGPDAH
jgi:hypothetical protein